MLNQHPGELAPLNGASPSTLATPAAANVPNHLHQNDVLDVGAVLSSLWRRRRLMLTTFALVALAGTLLTLRQRSIYEATCSILITTPSDNSPAAGDSLRALLSASQPRSVGTQLAIMRSYPVQRATIKRLSPSEQQVVKEFYSLEVRPQRDSDAIDIVAQSTNPKVAARLANALSEEYMAQYQEQNRLQVAAGTREVSNQLSGARKRLDEAAQALKDYKLSQGTVNLGEESTARLAQVDQIEIALRDLQAERAASVAQVKSLGGQIAGEARVQVTPDRIVRSPRLEALRTQLTTLDLQRIATLRRYRPGSPEVLAIEAQRADVQTALQSATKTEISSWTRTLNPIRQGLSQDSARAQTQIASIDARIAALRGAQERARAQQALLPEREYRLNQLLGDQNTLQQTYQLLNERLQSLLVSEGAKLTTARPLAPAEAPERAVRPRRALNLAMSVLLGGFLATLLALIADRMDDRVRSPQSAQNAAQLPVLAQIPSPNLDSASNGATPNGPVLATSSAALSPLLESFRLLRTNLMLPGAGGAPILPRSILVTSSREGEDAAGCALNLAVATALSGRKVTLIDADLRHPSLHHALELATEHGLGEVLRGQITFEDALQSTNVPNLQFLGGGASDAGAAELLSGDATRQILQGAISRAECMILLCPPVLGVADTPILATIAECALLVVSSEQSQASEIAQAREILARTGIHLPGLILNKVRV